jgi:hypothetical protein
MCENTTFGEILYRQIAGASRRIVNYAQEGMQVIQVLMLDLSNLVLELTSFTFKHQ